MIKPVAVIPARLGSERFPNKMLEKISGERVIDIVLKNACDNADAFSNIVLASPDQELLDIGKNYPIELHLQTQNVSCGSERAYWVYKRLQEKTSWFLSIPSDEPFIELKQFTKYFNEDFFNPYEIYTAYSNFYSEERLRSFNSCKIVMSSNEKIHYFSRNIIPVNKDGSLLPLNKYNKHVGLFLMNKALFQKFGKDIWSNSMPNESLEQNNFLENNIIVRGLKIEHRKHGVDSREDLHDLYK